MTVKVDLLESYQSGNIFTLADNVSNPDVANILSASLYAGLGPNDVSPLKRRNIDGNVSKSDGGSG